MSVDACISPDGMKARALTYAQINDDDDQQTSANFPVYAYS